MHIPPLISDLALILISASITTILFKWLKQPVILGYIVAGLLISTQFEITPNIGSAEEIGDWSELGVTFLMFGLGLEFSFKKLLNVGRNAFIASVVIIPCMILLGTLVGLMLGWGLSNSLILGGMICMSSTAIIMKAFNDMGWRTQKFTQLVLGILIFEDLIAILLLVVISTTAVSKSFEGGQLAIAITKLIFFMILWILSGIFILPTLLKWLKRKGILNDETLLIVSIGLCFLMVIIATNSGFSSELGAFVMGSILAETLEVERIDKIVKPLKDLFGAIFFVSVGMMIDLSILAEYAVQILIISITVIIGQSFFAICGLLLSGQTLKTSVQSGFCLTQIGEFAYIIAMLGTNLGILEKHIYPIIVAASVITIFITPFFMKLGLPAYNFLSKRLSPDLINNLERYNLNIGVSVQNENIWKTLLIQILRILSVYSIVIIGILFVYYKYLLPLVTPYGFWAKTILAIATILLISPFLRAIIAKKNHSREYKYLLASKKVNRAPLLVLTLLRFILATGFLMFILINTYNAAIGLLFAIASVGILIMFFSRKLKMYSIRMERRFFFNLNQREYVEKLQLQEGQVFKNYILSSRLKSYDLHLTDFEVDPDSDICGKTLIETDFRRKYGIHIVSIIRGTKRINIPGGKEQLFPYDKIWVLGADEQLDKVQHFFSSKNDDTKVEKEIENNEVSLEQFEISANNSLVGKTIKECGIRDFNKCLVVGIERDNESMMNPDVQTTLCAGDIVWIVGEKNHISKLTHTDAVSILEED